MKFEKLTQGTNEEIEKERYYDLARQLDIDLQEKLNINFIYYLEQPYIIIY